MYKQQIIFRKKKMYDSIEIQIQKIVNKKQKNNGTYYSITLQCMSAADFCSLFTINK